MKGLFIGSYPNQMEPVRNIFFKNLIVEMTRQGVDCTVISPVSYTYYKADIFKINDYIEELVDGSDSVHVYHPRMISYSAKKIGSWNTMKLTQLASEKAVLRVCKRLDMGSFDFVYGHFFLGGGLTASAVAQRYGLPAFIAYGECDFVSEVSSKFGNLSKKHVKNVNGIICVSSANYKDMESRSFAKDIPLLLSVNAIDQTKFHKMDKVECRRSLNLPQDEFIVGFVGYLIDRKGPDRVLAACKQINNVKVAFAGKGNMPLEDENIIFKRALTHDEIPMFLNAIDVFVLPTRHEGCCNAIIEAMACGQPVISSDRPFNYDVLTPECSILVDPENIEEIKKAIIDIRSDIELRSSMSKASLLIASNLTIDKRTQSILDFIGQNKKIR